MSLTKLKSLIDFVLLDQPIQFRGFKAIGYFPYEKAQLDISCVPVPRNLFEELEFELKSIMDNKIVVVFEDKTNFGTEDFAIQFKDAYCKMGALDNIVGYALRDLKTK